MEKAVLFEGTLKKNNDIDKLRFENSNAICFTIKSSISVEKIKVEVSFFNITRKPPEMTEKSRNLFFSIFATLAR